MHCTIVDVQIGKSKGALGIPIIGIHLHCSINSMDSFAENVGLVCKKFLEALNRKVKRANKVGFRQTFLAHDNEGMECICRLSDKP